MGITIPLRFTATNCDNKIPAFLLLQVSFRTYSYPSKSANLKQFHCYLPMCLLSFVLLRPPSRRKVSSKGLNVHVFLSLLMSGFSGLLEPILRVNKKWNLESRAEIIQTLRSYLVHAVTSIWCAPWLISRPYLHTQHQIHNWSLTIRDFKNTVIIKHSRQIHWYYHCITVVGGSYGVESLCHALPNLFAGFSSE